MRLLLFDIDGTLIQPNTLGRRVLSDALKQVFGTAGNIDDYSFAGKTDLKIVIDLLSVAGIPLEDIKASLPTLYDQMAFRGQTIFMQDSLAPCLGVSTLLAGLQNRDQVILGLQTGNIEKTAFLKLEAAGIDPQLFRIGAFGSDAVDRNDLLPVAWKRASAQLGWQFGGKETAVIGDTPGDITCAKAHGAMSVAVASGYHGIDSLAQCDPDYLLNDLSATTAIVDMLTQ